MDLDLALLILRVAFGLTLAAHGAQKMFGWFGGPGLAGVTGFFASQLRLRPAGFWAFMAALSELGGGLALALGFLQPLGSLGVIAAMLMAIILAHWPRFFNQQGGIEFPLMILVAGLVVGITGPGAYSLDNALGIQVPEPVTLLTGLVLVVIGVGVALASRHPAAAPVAAGEQASS